MWSLQLSTLHHPFSAQADETVSVCKILFRLLNCHYLLHLSKNQNNDYWGRSAVADVTGQNFEFPGNSIKGQHLQLPITPQLEILVWVNDFWIMKSVNWKPFFGQKRKISLERMFHVVGQLLKMLNMSKFKTSPENGWKKLFRVKKKNVWTTKEKWKAKSSVSVKNIECDWFLRKKSTLNTKFWGKKEKMWIFDDKTLSLAVGIPGCFEVTLKERQEPSASDRNLVFVEANVKLL